ncbi:MAG: gamma-glutamylcyclotransferase [Boseongicola sp.]|nr:gamma-glutamylcyclotransferase [Boseongicola sp.]
MSDKYVFGYGSLVNCATHSYEPASVASLAGWQREWRHVEGRTVAFLTISQRLDAKIDGLVTRVPDDDWEALDVREHSYDRTAASDLEHALPNGADIQFYHAPADKHAAASEPHPILLSYLDVVVQGFLEHFGEAGVARFFATTSGWDAPLFDDRLNPVYTRAQRLGPNETALVAHHVAA